jgi:hypothetical protein
MPQIATQGSSWQRYVNGPLVATDAEWDAIEALPDYARVQRTEATWTQIFDLTEPLEPYWHGNESRRCIQAVFEQLRLSNVLHVTSFRARPPRLGRVGLHVEAEAENDPPTELRSTQ